MKRRKKPTRTKAPQTPSSDVAPALDAKSLRSLIDALRLVAGLLDPKPKRRRSA